MVARQMVAGSPRPGVTLIEVVVTLTLLTLVAAIVAPSLRPPALKAPEAPTRLAAIQRTATREARSIDAEDPDAGALVVSPLGTCHPALAPEDGRRRVVAWDPVRCAPSTSVMARPDGTPP
jgi:prepilin-type N-terminal cleavage/methylation domain-containing protein